MTFSQLIKGAVFRFSTLKDAKSIPFWKAVVYLILLSVFLSLPIVYEGMQVLQEIKSDSLQIAQKVPDFQIADGEIQTEESATGFIYQTNSIILTFDPEGKRTEKDVANDLVGNYFSVGLLKNEAVLALPDMGGVSTSLFGDNVLRFPYTGAPFNDLTGAELRTELENLELPLWAPIVMLLAALYPTIISLIVTLLFTSIAGNLFAKMRLRQITFFETFKTLIFCATIPTILSMIIMFFDATFDSSLLITCISIFIFFQVSNHLPKMKLPNT
ncbi:DUF1189 domain-containing protein [Enterococcus sp. AZ109]|uniref:DUF1189 domain-containing protein n=1 Tax=Enterococcus sp. AZ109 TaxID=2774634 RepID=UPI003F26F0E2